MNNAEERMKAIEDLDNQVEMAVNTAIKEKNPVDGYRSAIEQIEEYCEDMNAPFIIHGIKNTLLRILRARVNDLMCQVEGGSGRRTEHE